MPSVSLRRRALAVAGASLLSLALLPLGPSPAGAQTQTVANEAALRAAVASNTPTIVLSANIELTCTGDPNVAALQVGSALNLQASSGTERTLSLAAGCTDRLIQVTGGAALTIERLHLTGGRARDGATGAAGLDGGAGGDGGAIVSTGSVTLINARFTNNHAGDGGAGGDGVAGTDGGVGGAAGNGGRGGHGGAVFTTGTVTATQSTFDNNRAGDGGPGGVGGGGGAGADAADDDPEEPGGDAGDGGDAGNGGNGGAIAGGTVTINRSTLSANAAGRGGNGGNGGNGGKGGDGEAPGGEMGGDAGDGGNAGSGGDGGAVSATGTITSSTSTLHGNAAGNAGASGAAGSVGGPGLPEGGTGATGVGGALGAFGRGGGLFATGNLTVTSSTITANTASDAAVSRSVASVANVGLNHSVVAGTGAGVDCAGTVTSTNSVAGDASCTGATVTAEGSLGLAGLANNGGPTFTRMPAANSGLVDTGATACPEATDQRGIARKQGTNCDIGAVERRGTVAATVVGAASDDSVAVGETSSVTFTLTFASTTTGQLAAEDLIPTITGCTSTPVRGGAAAPWIANSVVTWTCDVTSTTAGSVNVAYSATLATGEGTTTPLTATVPVAFQAASTTTTATTLIPVTALPDSGVGATGTGGGALPRTGLSILFTLVGGAALLGGGSTLTRYAKVRAARSPRWGIKYGVPYPAGTTKRRFED